MKNERKNVWYDVLN